MIFIKNVAMNFCKMGYIKLAVAKNINTKDVVNPSRAFRVDGSLF